MDQKEALKNYCLRLADNSLILGHRLSEWCGHGPILEEDLALINTSLDKIGQARFLYQYVAELTGGGKTEDDFAYMRNEREFMNTQLVEQPNGDYAFTIVRELLNDAFDYLLYNELTKSKDKRLAALGTKSLKEVTYHLRHCSDWVIRMGDGTEESNQRAQVALDELWTFSNELFEMNEVDTTLVAAGIAPDLSKLKPEWNKIIDEVLVKATLKKPETVFFKTGSRNGIHSEHLGHLLTEMQYLQRTYPNAEW